MKLIIQGQALSLEGDDGALVRLPEGVQIDHLLACHDEAFIPGRAGRLNVLAPSFDGGPRIVLTLTLGHRDVIHRPENAVEVKRTSTDLGEGRGTHHTEYLLVFQAPPFDVNHAVRPRLEGWTCTGGIQIKGELAPTIPFVWVFKRTVEGPPPELLKLTRDERARLFRGIWTPDNINALEHDLVRAFAPCRFGYRYVGESVTEVRGFGPDSAPFTSPDQLMPGETVPC